MYLVESLSRDKGSGRYTMYLPLFALQIPWGKGSSRYIVYLPDPLPRERDFTRYMGQSLNTHPGKHRSGGAQEYPAQSPRESPQQFWGIPAQGSCRWSWEWQHPGNNGPLRAFASIMLRMHRRAGVYVSNGILMPTRQKQKCATLSETHQKRDTRL